MKYIRNYKVFENNTNLTDDQKDFLNDCTEGKWKVNPDTGLIDVRGSFYCNNKNLDDFKGLQFGKVSGGFSCSNNNLKTLDGSPIEVGGIFSCMGNPLISLEGAPLKIGEEIGGYFRWDNFQTRYGKRNGYGVHYNLKGFLKEIKEDRPGVTELLLTHHFFKPEAINKKIQEDDKLIIDLVGVWDTPKFKTKQDELTRTLPPETLQKIKDFSAVVGYL